MWAGAMHSFTSLLTARVLSSSTIPAVIEHWPWHIVLTGKGMQQDAALAVRDFHAFCC